MRLLIRLKRIHSTNGFEFHDRGRSLSPNITHDKLGTRFPTIGVSGICQSHKLSIQKPSQHEMRLLIRLKRIQPTNCFEFHDLGIQYPIILPTTS
jgi:hypothetical protein